MDRPRSPCKRFHAHLLYRTCRGASSPKYLRSSLASSGLWNSSEVSDNRVSVRSTESPSGNWITMNARTDIAQTVNIPRTSLLAMYSINYMPPVLSEPGIEGYSPGQEQLRTQKCIWGCTIFGEPGSIYCSIRTW